jgi:hypothetical protein
MSGFQFRQPANASTLRTYNNQPHPQSHSPRPYPRELGADPSTGRHNHPSGIPTSRLSDQPDLQLSAPKRIFTPASPVPQRLGENLKQDALVVLVDQNPQLLALFQLLGGQVRAHLLGQLLVVGVRGAGHEVEAPDLGALAHLPQRGEDVVALEGQVLEAGALVVLQIGLDLSPGKVRRS